MESDFLTLLATAEKTQKLIENEALGTKKIALSTKLTSQEKLKREVDSEAVRRRLERQERLRIEERKKQEEETRRKSMEALEGKRREEEKERQINVLKEKDEKEKKKIVLSKFKEKKREEERKAFLTQFEERRKLIEEEERKIKDSNAKDKMMRDEKQKLREERRLKKVKATTILKSVKPLSGNDTKTRPIMRGVINCDNAKNSSADFVNLDYENLLRIAEKNVASPGLQLPISSSKGSFSKVNMKNLGPEGKALLQRRRAGLPLCQEEQTRLERLVAIAEKNSLARKTGQDVKDKKLNENGSDSLGFLFSASDSHTKVKFKTPKLSRTPPVSSNASGVELSSKKADMYSNNNSKSKNNISEDRLSGKYNSSSSGKHMQSRVHNGNFSEASRVPINSSKSSFSVSKGGKSVSSSHVASHSSSSKKGSFSSKSPYTKSILLNVGNSVLSNPGRDYKSEKLKHLSSSNAERSLSKTVHSKHDSRSSIGSRSEKLQAGHKHKQEMSPWDRLMPHLDAGRHHAKKPKVAPGYYADSDELEDDSELDDFIDDGPLGDNEMDYRKEIRGLFKYDPTRYRHVDCEDDRSMVSSFAQIRQEEIVSSKIGRQEDIEEEKREEEEKRAKLLRKKLKKKLKAKS